MEQLLEQEGKGEEHVGGGRGGRGRVSGGSAPATISAEFGVPISSRFRDSEMSWAVCPEHQHHCHAEQLPLLLLSRGSIDPSAQRQLEHIWLPDVGGSSQPGVS